MNPYNLKKEKHFWKSAIANRNMFDIENMWAPKYGISRSDNVATFGSCFAQHIGRALVARGFKWMNTEPAPIGMSKEFQKDFNYNIFSSRTGNIYTTSLFKQWVEWSLGHSSPPDEYWVDDGRVYDPFRPRIEPNGFCSVKEMHRSRQETICAFETILRNADVFVYTLGLTESWINTQNEYEYPMCPGTAAGEFDESMHQFKNQQFGEVRHQLQAAINMIREINPDIKILLTVSPVPLTATFSNHHILPATTYSKSVLRSVAGQLAINNAHIDYFPSYEIINSAPFRGSFFEPNQRSVNQAGVDFVMRQFFASLGAQATPQLIQNEPLQQVEDASRHDDVVCEEELLEAFGGK